MMPSPENVVLWKFFMIMTDIFLCEEPGTKNHAIAACLDFSVETLRLMMYTLFHCWRPEFVTFPGHVAWCVQASITAQTPRFKWASLTRDFTQAREVCYYTVSAPVCPRIEKEPEACAQQLWAWQMHAYFPISLVLYVSGKAQNQNRIKHKHGLLFRSQWFLHINDSNVSLKREKI